MTLPQLVPPGRATRNLNQAFETSSTYGERLSDSIARFGGSWAFITGFIAVLILWMGINSLQILVQPFDPYPFIFLNLMLSCLAALQAPVILMSQNRSAQRDRLQALHDYQVNLKAETEIESLHQKMDVLREDQWAELVRLQQRQILLLERILEANGIIVSRTEPDSSEAQFRSVTTPSNGTAPRGGRPRREGLSSRSKPRAS